MKPLHVYLVCLDDPFSHGERQKRRMLARSPKEAMERAEIATGHIALNADLIVKSEPIPEPQEQPKKTGTNF